MHSLCHFHMTHYDLMYVLLFKMYKNRNVDVIFSFPGGESCRGFFIVSLLVEMAAGSGITVSTS